MIKWNTVDDILDFAILSEENSAAFYDELAGLAERPAMKEALEQFAREALGHKAKLERVKKGKLLVKAEAKVVDLKMGDYLVETEPSAQMDYQDILIIAMKKEKSAFKLYSDLAAATDDAELQDLFKMLAQEEAKHKLRFELEYDEHYMRDN